MSVLAAPIVSASIGVEVVGIGDVASADPPERTTLLLPMEMSTEIDRTWAIADDGDVFGNAGPPEATRPFRWDSESGLHYLNVDPSYEQHVLTNASGSGRAVGFFWNDDGDYVFPTDAIVWETNGNLTNLGQIVPSDYQSWAQAVSDSGQYVAGEVRNASDGLQTWNNHVDGAIWYGGAQHLIYLGQHTRVWSTGVNDSGRVIGLRTPFDSDADPARLPWVKPLGEPVLYLPILGSGLCTEEAKVDKPTALNASGTIVGYSWDEGCNTRHAVKWTWSGSSYEIADLTPNATDAVATDISDSGKIALIADGQAFIDDGGVLTQVYGAGAGNVTAFRINERGDALLAQDSGLAENGLSQWNWSISTAYPQYFPAAQDPELFGNENPSDPHVEDPVSAATGNTSVSGPSLEYPGSVYGMAFTPTWNSKDNSESVLGLGTGWSTPLDASLTSRGGDLLEYRGPSGRRMLLTPTGTDLWNAPEGLMGTVRRDPSSGSYALQLTSGERVEFDSGGHLVRSCEGIANYASVASGWCGTAGNGQFVDVAWYPDSTDPTSVTMTSSTGMSQTFTLSDVGGANRLTQIVTNDLGPTGTERHVDLGYDAQGRLSWITLPHFIGEVDSTSHPFPESHPVDSFAYDPHSRITSMTRTKMGSDVDLNDVGDGPVFDPSFSVTRFENTYSPSGRTEQQVNQDGATTTFDYDYAAGTTTITSDSPAGGYESTTYTRDGSGRNLGIEDTTTNDVSRTWNQDLSGGPAEQLPSVQPTQFTDRAGASSGFAYDSDGRLLQRATPDPQTGFVPPHANDAGSETCKRLTDGTFPTPGVGSCSSRHFALESYEYMGATDSRLKKSTNAEGVVTDYTYPAADPKSRVPETVTVGAGTSEAVTSTYTSSQDRVTSITDGDGVKTCYGYNAAGQVTKTTEFCDTASAVTTTNTYSALGYLQSTIRPAPLGTITYTYYGWGLPKSIDSGIPGQQLTTSTYWPDGSTKSNSDGSGVVTSHSTQRDVTDPQVCGVDNDNVAVATPCRIETTTPPAPAGPTKQVFDVHGDLRLDVAEGGAVTSYTYGVLGRLMRTVGPTGEVTRLAYDANGRVTGTITGEADDPEATETVVYDKAGRVTQRTGRLNDATAVTTAYEYDKLGRTKKTTTAPGTADEIVNETTYRADGQIKQTQTWRTDYPASVSGSPVAATVERTYTPGGRLLCTDTRVDAASSGVPERHTYAAPVYEPTTYRTIGSRTPIATVTGCTDAPTDLAKWAVSMSGLNVDGSTAWSQTPEQYKYTTTNAIVPTDPAHANYRTTMLYDAGGRVTTVFSPDPANPGAGVVSTATCYTPDGQTRATIDESGNATRYDYDDAGRLTMVADARAGYDATTGCASNPDATKKLGVTTYGFDNAGRRSSRTIWLDNLTTQSTETWGYDATGRQTSHVDALGNATTTAYTMSGGRLTQIATTTGSDTDPSGASRRVETQTLLKSGAVGSTDAMRFDGSGQPTTDHKTVAFAYDNAGRRKAIRDITNGPTGPQITFDYNQSGDVTKVTYPDAKTTQHYWNLAGGNTKFKNPADGWFAYHLDAGMRVDQVYVFYVGWVPVANYTLDANGAVTHTDLAGGSSGTRDWTISPATGTASRYAEVVGTKSCRWDMTWDSHGRLATDQKTDVANCATSAGQSTTYSYDDASQLLGATKTNVPNGQIQSWGYTYGTRGNRLTQTVTTAGASTATTSYGWDAAGQLTSTSSTSGGDNATFVNDTAGRRVREQRTGQTTTYSYNASGKLVTNAVTGTGAYSQTRSYDPAGNLSAIDNSSGADYSSFWWNLATGDVPEIAQWTGNGVNIAFSYGYDRITATGVWYRHDHLNSTLDVTAPGVTAPSGYGPYGGPNPTYTGNVWYGYRSELTTRGLVHLRARDYDPTTGTFLTRDPRDGVPGHATEANPYAYGYNDPANRQDPTGKRPDDTIFDPPMVPISASSADCGTDENLPSEVDLQSYGLQGVSAHEEHCLEMKNVAYDKDHRTDSRTSFSGTRVDMGFLNGNGFSQFEQGAACQVVALLFNDPGACAVLWWYGRPGGAAAEITDAALAGERDPKKAGPAGVNAVRHFSWLALLAAHFTSQQLFDSIGTQKAARLTSVHEYFGLVCNGTDNECRWDGEADANNNDQGIQFGEQQFMQDANLDERKRLITDKAKEFLNSPGHLDLRGGCPSRYLTINQGC